MFSTRLATTHDVDVLVQFESALFAEDAAVHEEFADPTWPDREGNNDFLRLLASPDSIVLVAESDANLIGHLVGYTSASSPTRKPVTYANLRSLYVSPFERRSGVAKKLIDEFIDWARDQGCVEARVDSYAANEAAQALYELNGFSSQSISRIRRL